MEGFHSRHDTADATVEISSGVATVGEAIEFEIELTTMDANTVVRDLTLELEVPYRTTEGYRRATIDRFTLADELSVDSGITTTRTTTGTVPEETPGTFGSVDVWAKVAFDLNGTPVEREEYFDLAPSPQFRAVFGTMLSLGFAPRTFECLTDPTAGSEPFVRRFEFRPVDDPFDERFDKLELFVRAHPEGLAVFAAANRETTELPTLPEADEAKTLVRTTGPEAVRDHLQEFVETNADA